MRTARYLSDGNATDNPLHKTAAEVSLQVWSLLWEGDYVLHEGPGEDELYDLIHDAMAKALTVPAIRAEIAKAIQTGKIKRLV